MILHYISGGIGFDVAEFLTHNPYREDVQSDIHDEPLPSHLDKVIFEIIFNYV